MFMPPCPSMTGCPWLLTNSTTGKNSKRAKRLISSAKLRYPDADINTLILEPRGLSKPRMIALAAESYLIDARNIIINGYTGVGKTYLSCAIAKEACRRLHKTRYVRMPKMLEEFNLSTQTGSGISKLVKRYSTYHLLIVDEWLVEIPSEMEVKYLLEISRSAMIYIRPSSVPSTSSPNGTPALAGGVMADAIMDRIVHNADTGRPWEGQHAGTVST